MNTLSKIQYLSCTDSQLDGGWEPYFGVFADLPTLIETDLMDRTWITDNPDDVLLGGNKAPLYAISSERRNFIRTRCQMNNFKHQAISQWLRYYFDSNVIQHPQKETPEYLMEADALYRKAKLAMCQEIWHHVEWFSTNFKDPRIVWLTWEYLDSFAALEKLFSKRFALLGERPFIGKAQLCKRWCQVIKQKEELENNQEQIDYSYLESLLKSDPVSVFAASEGFDKIDIILSTIETACRAFARLNPDFDSKYWVPFIRAERHFMNVVRKDKRYVVPFYGNDIE